MADFYDSLNAIRTTAEIAPHWRMVSERSGQPIDERLMAVKAAQLQSEAIGEAYLRRLRRAALTERMVVSEEAVYSAFANETPGLDFDRFQASLANNSAERAFEADLAECAQYNATGFPTLLLLAGEKGIIAHGYRSFETYRRAIEQLVGPLIEHAPGEVETLLAEPCQSPIR